MIENQPPEPWYSFLKEIDDLLSEETYLHCLGGFVVTVIYGAERQTADLDVLSLVRGGPALSDIAGRGSDLHRRHRVYIDRVGIATLPENYEERLSAIFLGIFTRLRLFALDPYDLALAKIERNSARDREDVKHLARVVPFDLEILAERYHEELRAYLGNPGREDFTLKLWIEMIAEVRDRKI